ncbi:MAG: hypothetical protein Q8941_16865 [Bacteroidota bacterium]|nr:hypothetical protein [Bacteroidota bacterium]
MDKILLPMVTSVNKWLLVSAFILLTGFVGYYPPGTTGVNLSPASKVNHPFHISTTEINHNATDKSLEISCRIFTDDFETCLSKAYHTKADLSSANMKTAMDTLIKKYLLGHLQIKADDKPMAAKYLGFEKQDEAIYVYFESGNIPTVKKIEVTDSILYDLYDDQISIVHVIVGGNRKSTKLDCPKKEAHFEF